VHIGKFCPICKTKIVEQPEFHVGCLLTLKQFANNSPGFDIQFRPFFDD